MPELKLEKLFAAIGSAMYEAQLAVKEIELAGYWRYFAPASMPEDDPSQERDSILGAQSSEVPLTPIMRRVVIPYPDGKGVQRELQVPLVSLVHHNAFNLDQVKLRMKVSASVDEDSGKLRVGVGSLKNRQSMNENDVAVEGLGETEHEIELIFKREAPSEGVARITQEATKLL
jgi:hypothetical protein